MSALLVHQARLIGSEWLLTDDMLAVRWLGSRPGCSRAHQVRADDRADLAWMGTTGNCG